MHRKPARARHRKPAQERLLLAAFGLAMASLLGGVLLSPAAYAGSGAVVGSVWDDTDRDGSHDLGEAGFAGVAVYLFDKSSGALAALTSTDDAGNFSVATADGTYRVSISGSTWSTLANDWTPTTTGSLTPALDVAVTGGPVSADIGLRRIVRSTSTPISTFTGPSGLTVESYNDVVEAATIHSQVAAALLGGEASSTRVRFDLDTTNHTSSSWSGSSGSYSGYSSTVFAAYRTWLDDGGASLTHEYGHAWSLFQTVIQQQDADLTAYLVARGLDGNPRLGSDVYWQPREMVAEDYRQLFGSPEAASRPQANGDIPPAQDVLGLRDWLQNTFTVRAEGSPAPAPSPEPTPSPPELAVTDLGASPVPVVHSATMSARLSAPATVTLTLIGPRGKVVRTFIQSEVEDAGGISAEWDRRDDRGRQVKAGTYTLRLDAEGAAGSTTSATSSVPVV